MPFAVLLTEELFWFFLEGKLGRKGSFDLGLFSVVVRNMYNFCVLATQIMGGSSMFEEMYFSNDFLRKCGSMYC